MLLVAGIAGFIASPLHWIARLAESLERQAYPNLPPWQPGNVPATATRRHGGRGGVFPKHAGGGSAPFVNQHRHHGV